MKISKVSLDAKQAKRAPRNLDAVKKILLITVAAFTCLPAGLSADVLVERDRKKAKTHLERAKMELGKAAAWLSGSFVLASSIFKTGMFAPSASPRLEAAKNIAGHVQKTVEHPQFKADIEHLRGPATAFFQQAQRGNAVNFGNLKQAFAAVQRGEDPSNHLGNAVNLDALGGAFNNAIGGNFKGEVPDDEEKGNYNAAPNIDPAAALRAFNQVNRLYEEVAEDAQKISAPDLPIAGKITHYGSIASALIGLAYLGFATNEWYNMCSAQNKVLAAEAAAQN